MTEQNLKASRRERVCGVPPLSHLDDLLISGKSCLLEGCTPAMKALIISRALEKLERSVLILVGTSTGIQQEEFRLFSDLPFFTDAPIFELAAWETLPTENVAPSPDIVGARFSTLQGIGKARTPCIVLSSLQAALQKVLPRKMLATLALTIRRGQTYSFEKLVSTLAELGYERTAVVADKGEYAVRGGIVDLFVPSALAPVRLEFFGDEIDSIRAFDPATQLSREPQERLDIGAAREFEFIAKADQLETIFDYLGPSLIVMDDLEVLEDRYASLTSLGAGASRVFLGIEELLDRAKGMQQLSFTHTRIEQLSSLETKKQDLRFYSPSQAPHEISFEMFQRTFTCFRLHSGLEPLGEFLQREGHLDSTPEQEELVSALARCPIDTLEIYGMCQTAKEEERFRALAAQHALPLSSFHFVPGYLSSGFAVPSAGVLFFPFTELSGHKKIRRERMRTYYQSSPQDTFDIAPGDSVVHFHHGIGKFLGMEKRRNNHGNEQEFFLIEYAGSGRLYVPLTAAHLITKYVGADESAPKYHVLGESRWKRAREASEKAIIGYAADLLKLYAERKIQGGHAFPPDGQEIAAFEDEFPFIETEDQLAAIRQVKEDMSSSKAMDRLICGDVGYGKTEVALRAAFKAVVDGKKQVAILVPTTVLALQHYETFYDRMNSFGVRVALLSRLHKTSEIKKTIRQIAAGEIDIVVGTHRLVQADVVFKDLGLIIIDEEQRFGVRVKEHLKRLKVGVDCLILSATPIPRTLYLSIVGARALSVINTPPQDRLPIKTIIADPDDQVIQTALLRELNRDGQAYFIHNRIETIYEIASRLRTLIPKARIGVAHGQMDADAMDLVFHAFKKGDLDILVATSIVENGLDIPNANTIIVDHATRFGVADLYQLRGRVGRWNRRAYAYFLIPHRRVLSEIAQKRIDAIAVVGGHGGGFRIAMRDLEMRGAGDILGVEQSGHVSTIGFHLYCKLLKRTIDSLQGKAASFTIDTKIDIPFDARLPEYYVDNVSLRMEFYQRFGEAITLQEVDSLFKELRDRFGRPPIQAEWLYRQSRLRVFAAERGYTHVKIEGQTLTWERKHGQKVTSSKVSIPLVRTPEALESVIPPLIVPT